MKKIFLLLFSMVALTAVAATDYGIEINGTKVTSDKLSFSTGGGTVNYNTSSCTLTLNNVMFTRSGQAIKVSTSSNRSAVVKIVFNGTCLLTSTGSDAIVLEEGAELTINSITQIITNGSGKYAVHVYNDDDVSFYGPGSLLLEASDGYAVGGQSGGDEWAFFKINACTLNGDRGNLVDLGRVQINAINTDTAKSTTITLNPTKGGGYTHAQNVETWLLKDGTHIESPIGLTTESISNTAHCKKTFIISDERDDPTLTTIGNFQYGTGTYNGTSVAMLMKPTVAYKQSQPTVIEVPGFVTIGGSLRPVYVNQLALSGLTKVARIRYNFGVVYLGASAMDGCAVLEEVYIPSSVKEIAANAFKNAGWPDNSDDLGIYWATLNPANTTLYSSSFIGVAADYCRFYFPTKDVIEKAQQISNITTGNSIYSAPSVYAYDYSDSSKGLQFVVTKGFLTSDNGEMALVNCWSSITSISLTANHYVVLGGSKPYTCTSVAPRAFEGRTEITGASLGGIVEVGDRAFSGCSNLKTLSLSYTTTTIGMAAFYGTGITTVAIPQAVKTVGANAFSTSSLTSVTWNAANANDISTSSARPFENCSNLKTFTVGVDVTRMPANLCTNLTSLNTVNWNAKTVADFPGFNSAPFYGLSNISTFNFGSSVERIPAFLCYGKSNMEAVTLPSSLKTIGRCAFASSGLKSVTIPSAVTSMGECPFDGCESLQTVYYNAVSCNDMSQIDFNNAPFHGTLLSAFIIGNGVKRIPALLCYHQWDLNSISFPESVTEIGDLAFYECSGLKALTLPSGLTNIGQSAFSGCDYLANIYPKMMAPASLTYGNDYIFAGVDKETCKLTVPRGTLAAYRNTMPWKEFFHIVQEGGFTQGDVNGDGVVSGADVTALYNVLLDGATAAGDADVNGDGVVSGADVTALYNLLLN